MRTWWHSNPTLTGCKISSNKVSKWPWWKWTNSRIIMSNLTTKSVPVFYFSFTSRAKLMVQEHVGITVPEVSAWTDSHVGCHPRILWLVTFTSLLWWWQWPKCHQALFVRLPRSKAALIYILYLCLLCVQCRCVCNIILPVEKMSTTKIECWYIQIQPGQKYPTLWIAFWLSVHLLRPETPFLLWRCKQSFWWQLLQFALHVQRDSKFLSADSQLIVVDSLVFCSLHNPYVFHRSSIAGPGCETFYSFYSGGLLSLHSAALSSPASHFVTYWRRVTGRWWNARNGSSPPPLLKLQTAQSWLTKGDRARKRGQKNLTSCHLHCLGVIKLQPFPLQRFFCSFFFWNW